MEKYTIRITETLNKYVDVEATDYYNALDKVKQMYDKGEAVLTADDFTNVEFEEPVECAVARQLKVNSK